MTPLVSLLYTGSWTPFHYSAFQRTSAGMTLYVAVTVDADNDDFSVSDQRNELAWRGLDLIPEIAAAIHEFGWHATWFVAATLKFARFMGRSRICWKPLRRHGEN